MAARRRVRSKTQENLPVFSEPLPLCVPGSMVYVRRREVCLRFQKRRSWYLGKSFSGLDHLLVLLREKLMFILKKPPRFCDKLMLCEEILMLSLYKHTHLYLKPRFLLKKRMFLLSKDVIFIFQFM